MAIEDDPQYEQDRADLLNSPLGLFFPELKGGVWHCTGPQGYAGIRRSGTIEPSTGKHPYSYPQTSNSYALRNGYVSLFDFAAASESECFTMNFKWRMFFSHFEPFTAAIELDRSQIGERLVPASTSKLPEANNSVWIPYVEAWHDGPVPIVAVRRYLMVPKHRIADALWLSPDDPRHAKFEREALAARV